MNLQKKLIQLSEYKCSFKYVDSYFLVSMTYPEEWSIIPSEDESIQVAEEEGVTFYAAPIETDIDAAFTLIDETISYNLDVEKKMALLKYNIGKLQELFAEKDLDELETIEFTFKPRVQKQKTNTKPSGKKRGRKPSTKKIEDKHIDGATSQLKETKKDMDTNIDMENVNEIEEGTNYCEERGCMGEPMPTAVHNKYLEEVER